MQINVTGYCDSFESKDIWGPVLDFQHLIHETADDSTKCFQRLFFLEYVFLNLYSHVNQKSHKNKCTY